MLLREERFQILFSAYQDASALSQVWCARGAAAAAPVPVTQGALGLEQVPGRVGWRGPRGDLLERMVGSVSHSRTPFKAAYTLHIRSRC